MALKSVTRQHASQRKRKHPVAKFKAGWTQDEDEILARLVEQYGEGNWSPIARALNGETGKPQERGRIGKQCRERWNHHLRPDIRKDAWTEAEEKLLVQAHQELGNKWSDIAKVIPGRTENSVKNHWNATARRRLDSTYTAAASPLKAYLLTLNLTLKPKSRKRKTPPSHHNNPQPPKSVAKPNPSNSSESKPPPTPTAVPTLRPRPLHHPWAPSTTTIAAPSLFQPTSQRRSASPPPACHTSPADSTDLAPNPHTTISAKPSSLLKYPSHPPSCCILPSPDRNSSETEADHPEPSTASMTDSSRSRTPPSSPAAQSHPESSPMSSSSVAALAQVPPATKGGPILKNVLDAWVHVDDTDVPQASDAADMVWDSLLEMVTAPGAHSGSLPRSLTSCSSLLRPLFENDPPTATSPASSAPAGHGTVLTSLPTNICPGTAPALTHKPAPIISSSLTGALDLNPLPRRGSLRTKVSLRDRAPPNLAPLTIPDTNLFQGPLVSPITPPLSCPPPAPLTTPFSLHDPHQLPLDQCLAAAAIALNLPHPLSQPSPHPASRPLSITQSLLSPNLPPSSVPSSLPPLSSPPCNFTLPTSLPFTQPLPYPFASPPSSDPLPSSHPSFFSMSQSLQATSPFPSFHTTLPIPRPPPIQSIQFLFPPSPISQPTSLPSPSLPTFNSFSSAPQSSQPLPTPLTSPLIAQSATLTTPPTSAPPSTQPFPTAPLSPFACASAPSPTPTPTTTLPQQDIIIISQYAIPTLSDLLLSSGLTPPPNPNPLSPPPTSPTALFMPGQVSTFTHTGPTSQLHPAIVSAASPEEAKEQLLTMIQQICFDIRTRYAVGSIVAVICTSNSIPSSERSLLVAVSAEDHRTAAAATAAVVLALRQQLLALW